MMKWIAIEQLSISIIIHYSMDIIKLIGVCLRIYIIVKKFHLQEVFLYNVFMR